jgi:hypothetical protein
MNGDPPALAVELEIGLFGMNRFEAKALVAGLRCGLSPGGEYNNSANQAARKGNA